MEDIIKVSLNNWSMGTDYPEDFEMELEPGLSPFLEKEFCEENKLCVVVGTMDMSVNYTITAPAEWVKKYIPSVLGTKVQYNTEAAKDSWYQPFLDYTEENIGLHWYDNDKDCFIEDENE